LRCVATSSIRRRRNVTRSAVLHARIGLTSWRRWRASPRAVAIRGRIVRTPDREDRNECRKPKTIRKTTTRSQGRHAPEHSHATIHVYIWNDLRRRTYARVAFI
jgi:hypothetical protein